VKRRPKSDAQDDSTLPHWTMSEGIPASPALSLPERIIDVRWKNPEALRSVKPRSNGEAHDAAHAGTLPPAAVACEDKE
jgi:hypothetical protein